MHAGVNRRIEIQQDPEAHQFWADMNRYNSSRTVRVNASRRKYQQERNRKRDSLFAMLIRMHVVYTVVDTVEATDPRDRIYALLSMANEEPKLLIQPDYSKSVVEVFTDAAAAIIGCGQFDILSLNQFPKNQRNLPSWVPDWTSYIQRPCGSYKVDECYQACGEKEACIEFQSLPGGCQILKIKGGTVDTITKVGEPWLPTLLDWQEWTYSDDRCATFFDSIAAFCAESDTLGCDIYKDPLQRLEAPWRIPCANKARDSRGTPCKPNASGTEILEGYTYIQNRRNTATLGADYSRDVQAYHITMGNMFKRRSFLSKQGYVGLAPSHSKPGDVICILYGSVVPFVLRKKGSGYELIGEAYVHGIMDGEFVEKEHGTEIFEVY
jgi:hypothetical protein